MCVLKEVCSYKKKIASHDPQVYVVKDLDGKIVVLSRLCPLNIKIPYLPQQTIHIF